MGQAGRNREAPQFCDACFSGEYPISLTDHDNADNNTQMSLLAELT
jgi:amidophosphoribosyltransferase